MPSLFFGQYLVAKEAISAAQLLDALSHQRAHNKLLGELALESQMLTEQQVEQVKAEQRKRDIYFGDAAVALGFLTKPQVNKLLEAQKNTHMSLSQAVIELKFASREQVENALNAYNLQRKARSGGLIALEGAPPVAWLEPLLSLTQKTLLRVAGLDTRVGEQAVVKPGHDVALFRWTTAVRIKQPWTGEFIMSMPDRIAETIAQQASPLLCQLEKPNPAVTAQSVHEVGNVVAVLTTQTLKTLGLTYSAEPVEYRERTLMLRKQTALTVELATKSGLMRVIYTFG